MTYQEYVLWLEYFEERPVGWREDRRTYMMLRAAGVKAEGHKLFDSLDKIKKHQEAKQNKAVPGAGTFLHMMMMQAKGGDKVEFLKDL